MTIQSIDPKTGDKLSAEIQDSTFDEISQIIEQSQSAFEIWSEVSTDDRAKVLEAIASALDENVNELAQLADQETALGLPRLVGEVARTTLQLRLFASELKKKELLKEDLDEKIKAHHHKEDHNFKEAGWLWVQLRFLARVISLLLLVN